MKWVLIALILSGKVLDAEHHLRTVEFKSQKLCDKVKASILKKLKRPEDHLIECFPTEE
jgi:hypothetical protein